MTVQNATPGGWLHQLAGRSLDALPSLADHLVEQMWDDVYDPSGPVPKDDLWRSCHDNLGNMLEALRGRVPTPHTLLQTARATGARRAQQHCPLEWVLQAWHSGGEIIWNDLAQRAGAGEGAELHQLVRCTSDIWGVTDRFSIEMAATYQRVEHRLLGGTDRHLAEIIDALLHGRVAQVETEAVRALRLGADQRFLVAVAEDAPPYHGAATALAQALHSHDIHSAWRLHAGTHVGVIPTTDTTPDNVAAILRLPAAARIGLSPMLQGLPETPSGYRMAALAMATLPAHRPAATTLDRCLPDALLLASPDLARRLVATTFGPLLQLPAHERDELLRTVQAWVHGLGSPFRAAKTLYCHRNTVLNRLNRVRTLTGLDPHDVGVWPQLMLAMSALQQESGTRPESP
ncbi:PucR family transcriptional regulator [Amycolatopsis sp. K13G38]|uniref:PucR family transcriptional regulator n=1 Tax=Amycolatopsis acididurans TaxID=2724524 RepID=A0ABX1J088_9PSEU|nr:helix-turn-helix domain-containing protein [Amycolatopsis acididurans]NKQ53183.1 PucR family transcriptional regulator [Amycolatopsis acididurans]